MRRTSHAVNFPAFLNLSPLGRAVGKLPGHPGRAGQGLRPCPSLGMLQGVGAHSTGTRGRERREGTFPSSFTPDTSPRLLPCPGSDACAPCTRSTPCLCPAGRCLEGPGPTSAPSQALCNYLFCSSSAQLCLLRARWAHGPCWDGAEAALAARPRQDNRWKPGRGGSAASHCSPASTAPTPSSRATLRPPG